jgi:hypothetical protein
MNTSEYVKLFRPSLKTAMYEAYYSAKGLTLHDAMMYKAFGGFPQCCICNRYEDFIFDAVKLYRYWDAYSHQMLWICTDHGKVIDYNCITGEKLELPLPMPYWKRHIRDFLHRLVLYTVIPVRFVWYFSYSMLMWYVLIYPMWWMKVLKRKLCDEN